MDERQIIALFRAGNREAFGDLVRLHQARLRGFVAHYVENSHDVYDIVQDAFLDAFRNLHSFDLQREFYPWLRAICRNRMLNFLRARRLRRGAAAVVDEALAGAAAAAPDEPADTVDRIAALKQCIEQLAPSQRDVLGLRYADGVAVKDLASRLQRSAASVSMQLHRLRSILLECVNRRLGLAQS
jgi:RNA polymerase sigma-70 factor (ECF subfamily)